MSVHFIFWELQLIKDLMGGKFINQKFILPR